MIGRHFLDIFVVDLKSRVCRIQGLPLMVQSPNGYSGRGWPDSSQQLLPDLLRGFRIPRHLGHVLLSRVCQQGAEMLASQAVASPPEPQCAP